MRVCLRRESSCDEGQSEAGLERELVLEFADSREPNANLGEVKAKSQLDLCCMTFHHAQELGHIPPGEL